MKKIGKKFWGLFLQMFLFYGKEFESSYNSLSEEERNLLSLRFGIDNKIHSFSAIGKTINRSPTTVRDKIKKIIRKLRYSFFYQIGYEPQYSNCAAVQERNCLLEELEDLHCEFTEKSEMMIELIRIISVFNNLKFSFLFSPIEHIFESTRILNGLHLMGVKTIYDLVCTREDLILMVKGLGTQSLDEIKSELDEFGYKLNAKFPEDIELAYKLFQVLQLG